MPQAEESLPGIISQLQAGNWVAGTESYFEYQLLWFKESNFNTLTTDQEDQFAKVIEGFVAKYGLEHFGAMLLRRMLQEYQTFLSKKSSRLAIAPPDPNRNMLDVEFCTAFAHFLRSPPSKSMKQTHAETMAELEGMKATCSLDEYKNIGATQAYLADMYSAISIRENACIASKNLEKKGMRACWDQVVEVFVHIRDPIGVDQANLATQRKIVASHLDDMIAKFGFAAVEDQVRKRMRALYEEFDPTVAYFRRMDINCPPELEKAIHKLFRD